MTSTLRLPPTTETLHVFLLAGQSESVGKASTDKLIADNRYATYHDEQSSVWFAGHSRITNDLVIVPMKPGLGTGERGTFGPEVSMGYHFHRVTNEPVMIIKLAWGGTNVYEDWNPYTKSNQWDRDADDGTAAFLKPDYKAKEQIYISFVHHSRLVFEKLRAANIPFVLDGLFWAQGDADEGYTWSEFGQNTAILWTAFRNDIGRVNGQPHLPIVDNGGTGDVHLRTGKDYARQLMCDVNVTKSDIEYTALDVKSAVRGECILGGTDEQGCVPFLNIPRLNEIGWDPAFTKAQPRSDTIDYSQADFTKVFHWYVDYPIDMHGGYDKKILDGQVLMDGYFRSFAPDLLEPDEPNYQGWQNEKCAVVGLGFPSVDNQCYVDLRSEEEQNTSCDAYWKDWEIPDPDQWGTSGGNNGGGNKKKDKLAELLIPLAIGVVVLGVVIFIARKKCLGNKKELIKPDETDDSTKLEHVDAKA